MGLVTFLGGDRGTDPLPVHPEVLALRNVFSAALRPPTTPESFPWRPEGLPVPAPSSTALRLLLPAIPFPHRLVIVPFDDLGLLAPKDGVQPEIDMIFHPPLAHIVLHRG